MTGLLTRLDRIPTSTTVLAALVLVALMVLLDVVTGEELSFSIFYVAPVMIVAWRLGRRLGLATALVAAIGWLVADIINGREYSQALIPIWNGLARLGFFMIIAALVASESEVLRGHRHQARTDVVTGLLNRRGFVERAEVEVERAKRFGQPLSIAYIDVDHFKRFNDTHGHRAGDELLRNIGATLEDNVRTIDAVGRIGGDEFALALPATTPQTAIVIVERCRSAIADAGGVARIGLSIGVVTFTGAPADLDAALQAADEAMYRVKAAGRGSVHYVTIGASDSHTAAS